MSKIVTADIEVCRERTTSSIQGSPYYGRPYARGEFLALYGEAEGSGAGQDFAAGVPSGNLACLAAIIESGVLGSNGENAGLRERKETDMIRRDRLWKRIWATILTRRAVRVVFVGPSAQPDPRIERAREKAEVRPMDAAFFETIKEFLAVASEKQTAWSQTIRPKADAAMANLWTKLWKTPEGKKYQALKAEVDRRKTQVDSICKKAEDGVTRKILSSGQVVTYLKASVLVGNDELLDQARQNIEKLKYELAEAKKRLAQLEKGQEQALERINVLVVEEMKAPAKPKPAYMREPWVRTAEGDVVQEAVAVTLQIDELIADELTAVDAVMGEFVAVLEKVAQQQIFEEDWEHLAPEPEAVEQPVN